jgi:hypothetical protein
MKFNKFLSTIDVSRHIANHVIGEHHTVSHRRTAGVFVMFIGVTLAHFAAHAGNVLLALSGDLIGYSIHATGFLPFLHDIESKIKGEPTNETKCETC